MYLFIYLSKDDVSLTFSLVHSTPVDTVCLYLYTHGNKLGNTCNNVTTNFGLYISFSVKIMKNVWTTCQNM